MKHTKVILFALMALSLSSFAQTSTEAFVNVALSIILGRMFGLVGVALGTVIPLMAFFKSTKLEVTGSSSCSLSSPSNQ